MTELAGSLTFITGSCLLLPPLHHYFNLVVQPGGLLILMVGRGGREEKIGVFVA